MGSTINLHQEQSTVSLTAITVRYRSSVRKRNLLYILKWLLTQKEPLKKRRAMKRKQKLILKIRLKKKQKKVKERKKRKNNKHFFIFLTCDKHQYIILVSPSQAAPFSSG